MRIFLDTNVLLASVLERHADHQRAFPVLKRVHEGKDEGYISAHSLAEVYSNLTKLPPPFRHSPEQALLSIEENVLKHFKIVSFAANDYALLIREAALAHIQGGTVYDALLLKCASKAEVSQIYTLNLKHFEAVAPESIRPKLVVP